MPQRAMFAVGVVVVTLLVTPARSLQLAAPSPDTSSPMTLPFSEYHEPRSDDWKTPRMLVMRGCSGSSAVMLYARVLMRLHGIPVPAANKPEFRNCQEMGPEFWASELTTPYKNCFYDDAQQDIGEAMRLASEKIKEHNQTLFFQGSLEELSRDPKSEWVEIRKSLKGMHVIAVMAGRRNLLDTIICQIKDCFNDNLGYPVDDDGNQTDLCFGRREKQLITTSALDAGNKTSASDTQTPQDESLFSFRREITNGGIDYKAYVKVENLTAAIEREKNLYSFAKAHLEEAEIPHLETFSENLLEFETDLPGAMERGIAAWSRFLESLHVRPDLEVIRDFLSNFANTYPRDKPHREIIYNAEEVRLTLEKEGLLDYWRDHA